MGHGLLFVETSQSHRARHSTVGRTPLNERSARRTDLYLTIQQEGNKQHRPNSNFCRQLKKNSEGCASNQVSAAAMTRPSDEKWRPFNCFFSRVGLRTYQHSCTTLVRDRQPKASKRPQTIFPLQSFHLKLFLPIPCTKFQCYIRFMSFPLRPGKFSG